MMKSFLFLLVTIWSAAAVAAADQRTPEQRLADLGLKLPATSAPVANYVSAVRSGQLIFLAGHIPRDAGGKVIAGKVGREIDEAAAAEAARVTGLALIATLKAELGELRRVKRIVRVGGFVNSPDDYTRQPAVINGCSDLLVAVFGDAGRHARAAVGVNTLPLGAVVEIELVAEISD
jgi:enamine deaminase RidA (YjgF/YER057c/UK114 family)